MKSLSSRERLIDARASALLRSGEHVVAVPLGRLMRHRPFRYVVVVRRGAQPDRREVYPVPLANRLPEVDVPLRPPDPDVRVDLQRLFDRVYEGGAYWKRIDYAAPPAVALEAPDLAWAREVLSRRG